MAVITRTSAKAYFETGDKPTQSQFGDFIDSALFYEDTSDFGRSLVSAASATSARNLLGSGAVGSNLFTVITTASGQTQLGGGIVGRQVFEAITTASGRSVLDAQPLNANLTALAGLSGAFATITTQGVSYLTNPIILSNNATTPNTKIDFAVGSQVFTNGANQAIISATTAIIQSSGSWTAGNDQNKLDTGSRANNTWYYSYIIQNNTSGVYDVLFSTSATSPTVPSGWTNVAKIRSGQVMTDASSNLRTFLKFANGFTQYTPSQSGYGIDFSSSAPTANQVNILQSITVPNQSNIGALVKISCETGTTSSDIITAAFTGSLNTPNAIPSYSDSDVACIGDTTRYLTREKICFTNSAQIRYSISGSTGARSITFLTLGYFDLN